jgi:hypothetical protein
MARVEVSSETHPCRQSRERIAGCETGPFAQDCSMANQGYVAPFPLAELSRRQFLKASGASLVALSAIGPRLESTAATLPVDAECCGRATPLAVDPEYVLNEAVRSLARVPGPARHDYGQFPEGDSRGQHCEGWRFPLVDTIRIGADAAENYRFNRVTFVYVAPQPDDPSRVEVIGSFSNLYSPLPLTTVVFDGEPTTYRAASFVVPKGEVHTYKYLVNGTPTLDPINPQRAILDNGVEWSRFFTEFCTHPLVLDDWEIALLNRLATHILPLRTENARRFVQSFYDQADRMTRLGKLGTIYRLDQPVGVVNFIDKLLAREEAHHTQSYHAGLGIIDDILVRRHPTSASDKVPDQSIEDLYEEMANDAVPGWPLGLNPSPLEFLQLLRRHTYTGAFSHPRHGGNAAAIGWAYLEETYRGPRDSSCFDWSAAIEAPLGANLDYHG